MPALLLFTDFGFHGPYTGQVKQVLARKAPKVPVIELLADAPAFDPFRAAYLLSAFTDTAAIGDVVLAVVDPGVGTERRPVVVLADGRWFVGPDNGLLALVVRRAQAAQAWQIDWRPDRLSATFHARDLFAPVAADIASGLRPGGIRLPLAGIERPDWPEDLAEILYCDSYGNAMTGLRTGTVAATATLQVNGWSVPPARTFADQPAGTPLWYGNSSGLVEIAVNQAAATRHLGLKTGMKVTVLPENAAQADTGANDARRAGNPTPDQ